ncbi:MULTISPECIES: AzlC family ABC transporter permease [Streptosporangium]|uniref:Branched-subunit amino acid permease n=1 Tax=Streptosporangium brasiliense TaxID=47480 RepID=A0ABT9RDY8_9ACTN|nr:AzlC family ABC transporter permease [Streptosporangium brasiliense]MDP9867474.1 putative branched-subunit amino acid permease [Streptosporangium brasiliense]
MPDVETPQGDTRSDLGLALGAAAGAATYSAVFGAAAVEQGWSSWEAVLASAVVHAGGSQIVGLTALGGGAPEALGGAAGAAGPGGGAVAAAVVAASLVNLRLTAFGLALGDVFRTRWGRWLAAHLVSDESVAAAVSRGAPAARRRTFLLVGTVLFTGWVGGTAAGAVLGSVLPAGARGAVDGAAAAAFAALLVPLLRTRRQTAVAAGAAALALVASWWLPPGLPILVAALAAVPAVVRSA